jgi:hypothetical protein
MRAARGSPRASRPASSWAFAPAVLVALVCAGCERGCARSWLGEHGVGSEGRRQPPGSAPLDAIDCADGLARCSGGVVEASRRTTLPWPCHGTPEQCACPWERVDDCSGGCVADGVEAVVPRDRAVRQLCAPEADAGPVATPAAASEIPRGCDEGQAYRCEGDVVTGCVANAVVARCLRGCVMEGTGLDDDRPLGREAAAAILCSR